MIQNSQNKSKTGTFELAYNTSVADRWDPSVRGPHMSVKRNRAAALRGAGAARARRRRVCRR